MKEINYITSDSYALYVGYTQTCMSCKIRLYEVEKVSQLLKEMSFYQMDVNENKDLVLDLKISKIPFFILSKNGNVEEIFYTYRSVEELYIKLLRFIRG